jgi:MYXO-CTERM domain-containing protein
VKRNIILAAALIGAVVVPRVAHAFCGFYVAGSGDELYNNATQVVMMRMGTRTVLSMQNNYQGPPEDFALVVPVPVVLQKEQVKTLPKDVFQKVDVMGSPRLVEYWEQDPCYQPPPARYERAMGGAMAPRAAMAKDESAADYGVKIEAQFVVGEYQILILSATESTGLSRWLESQHYKIPAGAAALLRPYVEAGSKFFVAKVDPKKVTFKDGMATLSPLRFYYDTDDFTLPIRLGLANAKDKQDLVVNILSPNQRYEAANYPNTTIPTNLDVKDAVRKRFAEFYAALFDRTVELNPGAVVTEYSWDASSCDPCPGPTLSYADFATLGADVLAGDKGQPGQQYGGGFVLTRLHARYGPGDVPDDLVFKKADAILGGREVPGPNGKLEEGAQKSGMNNFQARYIIRHEWTGPITCEHPIRGRWGGPPAGQQIAASGPIAATGTAFAPRGQIALPQVVAQAIPELKIEPGVALPGPARPPGPRAGGATGCGCTAGAGGGAASALGALGVLLVIGRRRRSRKERS